MAYQDQAHLQPLDRVALQLTSTVNSSTIYGSEAHNKRFTVSRIFRPLFLDFLFSPPPLQTKIVLRGPQRSELRESSMQLTRLRGQSLDGLAQV